MDKIEFLNDLIRESGMMDFDKPLDGFQFSCGVCGNTGFVGGEDGAILHLGERPECNVCGYRGINLFKLNKSGSEVPECPPIP